MLLLTRNIGERVIVRDDVYLEILEIRGSHVKIGIQAPPEVLIYREDNLLQSNKETDSNQTNSYS